MVQRSVVIVIKSVAIAAALFFLHEVIAMAVVITKQTMVEKDKGYVTEMTCDTTSDVTNVLPTMVDKYEMALGSTCLCIEDSNVYIMKSDKSWAIL